MLWADFFPAFWAPDEDYHFLYVDHLVTQGALPAPDKPLYTQEYGATATAISYLAYAAGPPPRALP